MTLELEDLADQLKKPIKNWLAEVFRVEVHTCLRAVIHSAVSVRKSGRVGNRV